MTFRAVSRLAWFAVLGMVSMTTACGQGNGVAPADKNNMLTSREQQDGWRLLFDGKTLDAWRGYQMQTLPDGWTVRDGIISKTTSAGDLISKEQFGDFDLTFDWKLGVGGNAGVFYRATEEYDHVYWTGPEYQLLDDLTAPDGRSRLTSAGAAYGLYPAPIGPLRPAGEWNTGRIVVKGAHVEHWMNGQKLLDYDLWSPDWNAKVKASKFSAWPHYGMARTGHLGIQGDHDGVLSLRNVKIRPLP